jgi:SAM-dependent methyltransferase
VLDFKEPGDVPEPGEEMVFYQPTPAREIFDFIELASMSQRDVVMDLGSGLGHVTLLAAICTGARSIGIELQPAYVAIARQCAAELQVRHVQFIEQDVRHADLSEGTVFYLYTPFTGGILRKVLDMLKRESEVRSIRLCTLGPCTATVVNEPWLKADGASASGQTVLFRSR